MKECCSTVTIPLEEYEMLKKGSQGWVRIKTYKAWGMYEFFDELPGDLGEEAKELNIKGHKLNEKERELSDKEISLDKKQYLLESEKIKLHKIPRFIRKIFGAL